MRARGEPTRHIRAPKSFIDAADDLKIKMGIPRTEALKECARIIRNAERVTDMFGLWPRRSKK